MALHLQRVTCSVLPSAGHHSWRTSAACSRAAASQLTLRLRMLSTAAGTADVGRVRRRSRPGPAAPAGCVQHSLTSSGFLPAVAPCNARAAARAARRTAGAATAASRRAFTATPAPACCPDGPEAGAAAAGRDVRRGAAGGAEAGAGGVRVRRGADGKLLPRYRRGRIYNELAKARLSALVVCSTGAGFLLAGGPLSLPALASVSLGTYLCAASANALNQAYEVDTDSKMARTRARPLPSGRITVAHAVGFAAAAGAAGTGLLCIVNSPLVAALGAANILLYAGAYTPLKRVSTLNTTVGAVVGAIPPLMGWGAGCAAHAAAATTAAAGAGAGAGAGAAVASAGGAAAAVAATATAGLGCLSVADPWLLAALLMGWQYPHFLSLSYLYRNDYAAGGYVMHSVVEPTGKLAARVGLIGGVGLAAVPLAAVAAGAATPALAVESLFINAYALRQMWAFYQNPSESAARATFRTSLWYLPLLMGLMVFHGTAGEPMFEWMAALMPGGGTVPAPAPSS